MIPGQTGFTYVTHDHELYQLVFLVTGLSKTTKIKMSSDMDALEVLLFEILCV